MQLIKFHGMYQQEDRDVRQQRKAAGSEKAYQFMIRSRIPGGVLTAEQYLVQDDLASHYANGTLRITTRQGFQPGRRRMHASGNPFRTQGRIRVPLQRKSCW